MMTGTIIIVFANANVSCVCITHLIQNNPQWNFKLWNPTLLAQYGLRHLLIKLNRPSRVVAVQTIITTFPLLLDRV